jgi:hypothetical protein
MHMLALDIHAVALAAACTGTIGGPDGQHHDPDGPSTWIPGDGSGDPTGAGTLPLSALTRIEHNNTVRDLLEDTSAPGAKFPGEITGGSGFATVGNISEVHPSDPAVRLEILVKPPAGPPWRAWVRLLLIPVSYFQSDFHRSSALCRLASRAMPSWPRSTWPRPGRSTFWPSRQR